MGHVIRFHVEVHQAISKQLTARLIQHHLELEEERGSLEQELVVVDAQISGFIRRTECDFTVPGTLNEPALVASRVRIPHVHRATTMIDALAATPLVIVLSVPRHGRCWGFHDADAPHPVLIQGPLPNRYERP
eukprot:CAMPEP_0179330278 /NCGR_PEP_ID=MMETSP0797-20121207/63581_1 /TAXON_ID=47934 /ORGANISM="Dinophysis acuminata, Strain DAEP01" /LENGTH=132 /DNA_ID=CAMNT_0021043001 /DNA_START=70 /DNA_END=464 /DNA_ORIENTATION=+